MNVGKEAFEALTAEVAQLAKAVEGMAMREVMAEVIFDAGFAAGQDDVRKSMGQPSRGRAGKPRRAAGNGHLRAVPGGRR